MVKQLRKFPKSSYIVHCQYDEYDVLIDRRSIWGNPFVTGTPCTEEESMILFGNGDHHGDEKTRTHVIALYDQYLRNNETLLEQIMELDGKRLGCWCRRADGTVNKSCHGDTIPNLINELKNKNMFDY